MKTPNTAQCTNALQKIVQRFLEECKQHELPIETEFAFFLICLLMRDERDGLDKCGQLVECKVQSFLALAVQKYADHLDATVCSLRLTYWFKQAHGLKLDNVRIKYEANFRQQLKLLVNDILQYPETSNSQQIEQMFTKMQVFIVARYNLGSPKNHVLLKHTRQSLQSVIGRGDLQNYVLKKKYHRLEYLERLGSTVGGIMIYNNQGPTGDKENIRDIFVDLNMAQRNTKDCLNAALQRAHQCKCYGYDLIDEIINIDVERQELRCQWPIEKTREINKFIVLFNVYEYQLLEVLENYEKTQYLITVGKNKLNCVVDKINDVLKFRSAIESELIFPHFVYLSEVWSELILYLNHLAELNRIKQQMDNYVSEDLEAKFIEISEQIRQQSKHRKVPIVSTFEELTKRNEKRKGIGHFIKVNKRIKVYCALTVALTNGLLVPAYLEKKLCENSELKFGFNNIQLAKYAEHNFEQFLQTYRNTIFTSVDLIILFGLEHDVMQQEEEQIQRQQPMKKELETQTEMVKENDMSVPSRINATWSAWDFHRETIRIANLRKRHTNSTQTIICYGQRNEQNQTYYTRRHF